MNAYLNDYVNISDKDYYSHLAFYESSAFVRETMLLKIPDVVQYVHNILSCLRDAEQSRLIVEDIESQIVDARTRHKGLISSIGYAVGSLHVDGRAYAQRHIREWCEYVSKTNDSLFQILNITFGLGFRPWDVLTGEKILKKLQVFNDKKLIALCEAVHQSTDMAQRLNNFSKHNLNIWGIEKMNPPPMKKVEYFVRYDGHEQAVSKFMCAEKEREIACCIVELLDYVFSKVDMKTHEARYYVYSSFSFEPKDLVGYVDQLSVPRDLQLPISFVVSKRPNGSHIISEVKMTAHETPLDDVYLAVLCDYNAPTVMGFGTGVFECNSIDVFSEDSHIGKYECTDPRDYNAQYFHFKKYHFTSDK